MTDVRAATIDDGELLAGIAAAGFYDDPVLGWVLPEPANRLAQLGVLFRGMVRDMLPVGGTVHLLDGASAAFWRDPDYEHHRADGDRIESAEDESDVPFSDGDMERLVVLGTAMAESHPHEPHWYLNVLSTMPERQGQGLGAQVLQPVLEICDRDGIRAYLESTNPRNMTLYRRQGFVDAGVIELPGGPPMYPMWRDPQG